MDFRMAVAAATDLELLHLNSAHKHIAKLLDAQLNLMALIGN